MREHGKASPEKNEVKMSVPHLERPSPWALRIVGGKFRGRKLDYGGDRRVRPMKDRVREALFNLIGPGVKGKHAVDVFGGTGAIGLEGPQSGGGSGYLRRTTLSHCPRYPCERRIARRPGPDRDCHQRHLFLASKRPGTGRDAVVCLCLSAPTRSTSSVLRRCSI